jgi:hypothetical protein
VWNWLPTPVLIYYMLFSLNQLVACDRYCRRLGPEGPLDRPVKSLRAPVQIGGTEWNTRGGTSLVLSCTRGAARSRGYKRVAWERDIEFVRRFPRANPPQGGPGPLFYRGKERIQTYNEGA